MRGLAAFFLLILLMAAMASPSFAAGAPREGRGEALDAAVFSRLPVLHEGRVKPLDSFARVELRRIRGRDEPPGGGAPAAWLAGVLFDPARAAQQKLFAVPDDALRRQLKLSSDRKAHVYSLAELAPGLAATESRLPALLAKGDDVTPSQRALLSLHDRALGFSQLLEALSMLLPLEGVKASEGADKSQRFTEGPTWLELKKSETAAADRLKEIVRRKGEDLERYTPEELALALSGLRLEELRGSGRANALLRIVPPQWAGQEEWLSPWMCLESGQGGPRAASYLLLWQDMAAAWRAGDREAWEEAVSAAKADVEAQAAQRNMHGFSPLRLRAEISYNAVKPFYRAEILYGLALLVLLASWALARAERHAEITALALTGTGVLLHAAGLALRVFILVRPPVGTLYESLLFVSLVVLLGALVAAQWRAGAILRGGLAASLGLLLAAPVVAPQGDSLEMLVAVLNTGFWLSTHVICITAGYGVSILAATLSHIALFRQGAVREGTVRAVLALALFLTAFGTVLGGIWADQSWGRFWGWDPKENGALLIVLWIAWILHGRLSGHLRGALFLTAAAFLNVIVALSWFGVNLLNIGLHSYGFTSAAAAGFAVFCGAEATLIFALYWRAWRRQGKAAPDAA